LKLASVPNVPASIVHESGKSKFIELCEVLLEDDRLTTGNVHAVELAAITYGQWRDLEAMAEDDRESKWQSLATKAKNDLFRMLKEMDLVKPPKTRVQPKQERTPLQAAVEKSAAKETTRPELKIVRLPNVDDATGTGS